MPASSVKWGLDTKILQANVGKKRVTEVSAYGKDFVSSEHVGGGSGTFEGSIMKTGSGYRAVGTFTPISQAYDFDYWERGSLLRKSATAIGFASGVYIVTATHGLIRPTDYIMEFEGSAEVDISW